MANPFKAIFEAGNASEAPSASNEKKKGGMFGMLDIIENNKAMLEGLPDAMEAWGKFQSEILRMTMENQVTLARVDANVTRILMEVGGGGIPEDIVEQNIADAADDPRNSDLARNALTKPE